MARTMTSPTSARSANRRGLTLVEVTVAMLVIVILATILIPTISKAQRQAKRTRIAADIQVIALALNEYRNTCGTFPDIERDATNLPIPNTGAAVLGKALMGLGNVATPPAPADPAHFKAGDCSTDNYVALLNEPAASHTDLNSWAPFNSADGADGLGFKLRVGGRTVPAFLQPDTFKTHGCDIYDIGGHPILYFPANPGKPNIRAIAGNVGGLMCTSTVSASLFRANDNLLAFRQYGETTDTKSILRLQMMCGDINCNGVIDPTETPIKVTDFLLYSAGLDQVDDSENGRYGPNDKAPVGGDVNAADNQNKVDGCDDVTNAQ